MSLGTDSLMIALLAGALAICAFYIVMGRASGRVMRGLGEGAARKSLYITGTLVSFVLITSYSIAVLYFLDRLDDIWTMPPEFEPVAAWLGGGGEDAWISVLLGVILGLTAGGIVTAFISARRRRSLFFGDVDVLVPRTPVETVLALILNTNASIGEEIFFRLSLPLLLIFALEDPFTAIAISTVFFGMVHSYQGFIGFIATGLAGLLFAFCYLFTGELWVAMVIHFYMNVNGLIIQPWLRERFRRK